MVLSLSVKPPFRMLLVFICWLSLLPSAAVSAEEDDKRGIQFFERKIRPILVKHCYECHSEDSDDIGGGLLLDSREASRKGGESGAAVIPKDVRNSLLLSSLEYRDFEMPPDGKLPDDVIRDFRRWIAMGAPDPRSGEVPADVVEKNTADGTELWSLQPVRKPAPPESASSDWPRSDVDRFVIARLNDAGLKPVRDADSVTLLRRVYFDLVGLPPSPEEIRQFERESKDDRQAAFESVVDRLLASPQFGERWGRHWMDVVRYGESAGNSRDVLMPWAFRYRDYLIDAFNKDIPFDRFLTEQIAGDLLEADSPAERSRLQVATGLLAVGSKSLNGGNIELDIVDDQIDVISKSVLGLTASCARCHDHKFDPIPTADYYALAGIFRNTQTLYGGSTRRPKSVTEKLKVYLPLGSDADKAVAVITEHQKKVDAQNKAKAAATKKIQQVQKKLPKDWKEKKKELSTREASAKEKALLKQVEEFEAAQQKLKDIQAALKELSSVELPELNLAVGVRDRKKSADWPIQIRGDAKKKGDIVPRGFLSCVTVGNAPAISSTEQSGRIELAQWLTRPDHPLTPRVAVNRIWQHLFGRGLVETVDNFGVNGQPPSHPELLDWLASRFVHENHWSFKRTIRELVLCRTYQLASDFDEASYEADPANTLYWRMSRRRLEAEPLRDAMLAAAGQLNLDRPYGSAVTAIGEGEVGRGINEKPLSEPFPHRSVYLPIIRTAMPEFLRIFDVPESSNPQGLRDATNVPGQSLYLMNSPFVIEQATKLAERVILFNSEPERRLEEAYLLTLSRRPTGTEIARTLEFLDRTERHLEEEQPDATEREQLAWTILSQALIGSAEFRFLD